VIIIEHNLDVIRNADWILDLGPEGGEEGGRVVAQGTPEQVSRVKKSYTGQALIEYFNGSRRNPVKNASTRNEAEKSVLAPTGTEAMA
jgi:excinuclease ABC subunit A